MLSLLVFELKLKRRSVIGWFLVLLAYIGLVAWAERALEEGELAKLYEELVKQYPEEFIKIFGKGVPQVFTPEIFYTIEYFVIMYVIVVAAYIAYVSAGSIVDDVLEKTGFLVLTTPQPRSRILLSRLAANVVLASTITLLSLILTILLVDVIAERNLNVERIVLLHANGVLYLVACASLGALLGSILPIAMAKLVAPTVILLGYALDTMTVGTNLEVLGYLSLTRYFPVAEIVAGRGVNVEYALVLVVVAIAMTILAVITYNRRDLPV